MGSGFRFTEQHLDGLLTGAHAFATGPKNLRTRDGTDLLKAYSELRLSRHGQDHHRRFADVFYAVDQALGRSVRDFYPNDLAIAASSFASVNCDAPRFFRDLLRNADHCFAEHRNSILKFESASDVLRACAALGWFDEDAMARLGQLCADRIDHASDDALTDAVEALARLGGLHASPLWRAVVDSKRNFESRHASRILDAFALAGAWHEDFLSALSEHASSSKIFLFAAAAERPSLLPPGISPEPLQDSERRKDIVAKVVSELNEWGWACATIGGADALCGDVCCLFDDRLVRDVGDKRDRPDGTALLHARLALRAGRRLEFVAREALDEARASDTARAALLARLKGDEPSPKKARVEEPAEPAPAPPAPPVEPTPAAMETEPTAAPKAEPEPAPEPAAAAPEPAAPAAPEASDAMEAEPAFDEAAATKECKKLTVPKLRAALEAAGADTKGLKAALVERLVGVKRAAAAQKG